MTHLTMNTGHVAELPGDLVHPITRASLAPLIGAGAGNLPGLACAYRIVITTEPGSAAFTLYRARDPLTLNMLYAGHGESCWPELEEVYLRLSDRFPGVMAATEVPMEPSGPWIGTILLPHFSLLPFSEAGFIGQIGACFGLLLMEKIAQRA